MSSRHARKTALAAAIVAALLMGWIPARRAARVLPAEVLRYE